MYPRAGAGTGRPALEESCTWCARRLLTGGWAEVEAKDALAAVIGAVSRRLIIRARGVGIEGCCLRATIGSNGGLPWLVFGGYDIRKDTLFENAEWINEATGTLNGHRLPILKDELDQIEKEIKPGLSLNCGESICALVNEDLPKNQLALREVIREIQNDLKDFVDRHQLHSLVVLNLASTEPFHPEYLFESRGMNLPYYASWPHLPKPLR